MSNPYKQEGPPTLHDSYVCYADILGYTRRSREAIKSGQGVEFLQKLRYALSTAYDRVREHAKGLDNDSLYEVNVFTDNIVVGYPVERAQSYGEHELGRILSIFSEFQAVLSMEGFFLRGGIAYGAHYMDEDIVFGDALLDAVAEQKSGGPPRISLSPSAVEMVRRHLGFYNAELGWSPYYDHLLEDADGAIFLNYLGIAFSAFPDAGIFFEVIEGHQSSIIKGLMKYKGDAGVRAKYEWAARYHNFVCRDFSKRHPIPTNPDSDEMYAAACLEVQRLSEYEIEIESFAPAPTHISLTPFKSEQV